MSCLITSGNCNSEEEKMIGITFAVFTFTGNVDPNPPSWLPPWIFLEYCTGILLSASFKIIVRIIVPMITMKIITPAIITLLICLPSINFWYRLYKSLGIRETMLQSKMMEIPFPTPLSVICSPSHITKTDPAVKQTIISITISGP